jgi:hypothetical protein
VDRPSTGTRRDAYRWKVRGVLRCSMDTKQKARTWRYQCGLLVRTYTRNIWDADGGARPVAQDTQHHHGVMHIDAQAVHKLRTSCTPCVLDGISLMNFRKPVRCVGYAFACSMPL